VSLLRSDIVGSLEWVSGRQQEFTERRIGNNQLHTRGHMVDGVMMAGGKNGGKVIFRLGIIIWTTYLTKNTGKFNPTRSKLPSLV
jgi:hypothetical protein